MIAPVIALTPSANVVVLDFPLAQDVSASRSSAPPKAIIAIASDLALSTTEISVSVRAVKKPEIFEPKPDRASPIPLKTSTKSTSSVNKNPSTRLRSILPIMPAPLRIASPILPSPHSLSSPSAPRQIVMAPKNTIAVPAACTPAANGIADKMAIDGPS